MTVLLISSLTLVSNYLCYRILNKCGKISLLQPSIETYVYFFVCTVCQFSATAYFLGINNYTLRFLSPEAIRLNYIVIHYSCLSLCLFLLLFNRLFQTNKNEIRFFERRMIVQPSQSRLAVYVILLVVCTFATFYSYSKVPTVPILEILKGGDGKSARYMAKFGFTGNGLIKNLFMVKLSIILSLIIFAYTLGCRKFNLVRFVLLISSVALCVLSTTFTGAKAPILIYLLCLYSVYTVIRGPVPVSVFLFIFVTLVTGAGALFFINAGHLSLSLYSGIVSRILIIPTFGHVLTLQLFPLHLDFLYGQSLPNTLINPFGYESIRSARLLMSYINPVGVAEGRAGIINSLFTAEAFANFAWYGIIVAPIYVALFVVCLKVLVFKIRGYSKSPESVALYAYVTWTLPFLGGFADFIWNIGLVFVLIVCYWPFVLGERIKK